MGFQGLSVWLKRDLVWRQAWRNKLRPSIVAGLGSKLVGKSREEALAELFPVVNLVAFLGILYFLARWETCPLIVTHYGS